MNKAILLFPGEFLPYHVVDYALSWAKENEGSLKVIFILPKGLPEEGYPFPNDLDQAELLKNTFDSEQGIKQILQDEIRFIEKRANGSHIPIESEIMLSPSIDDVMDVVNDAEVVFIDKNLDDQSELVQELPFSVEELKERTMRPLYYVGEYDRYSDVFY